VGIPLFLYFDGYKYVRMYVSAGQCLMLIFSQTQNVCTYVRPYYHTEICINIYPYMYLQAYIFKVWSFPCRLADVHTYIHMMFSSVCAADDCLHVGRFWFSRHFPNIMENRAFSTVLWAQRKRGETATSLLVFFLPLVGLFSPLNLPALVNLPLNFPSAGKKERKI